MTERIEISCSEYDRLHSLHDLPCGDGLARHGAWPDDECGSGYYWWDRLPNGAQLHGKRDANGCRHWIEAP